MKLSYLNTLIISGEEYKLCSSFRLLKAIPLLYILIRAVNNTDRMTVRTFWGGSNISIAWCAVITFSGV